ncbi:RNA polymerase sigma factor [Flexithrix dorotheae]|uniref:RNA polymerase sigma factor n=1 Tax=Flexithrix dorotheae TaxID=70993 RepID=UPI00036D15B8|nr:RNA polymerase sigma-70 factor [Flexithrix dorotheae]|eukprot:TRINITY_DN36407_c0_g2_i1.p1 TRINITY_DN36407_c0_g2~~TRINITY_DN36407_c0_g2_i1.p1  ORF type:complete len:215 (-),score=11.59 TRINITY_DN36407_c0_g2_i1:118-672(-)
MTSENYYQNDDSFCGEKVFEEYYYRYYEQLHFKAFQYLKSQELVEDAIQDVFLKLWKKRNELHKIDSIEAFLFTCMRNHVLNMIRSHKREILKQVAKYNHDGQRVNNETEDTVCLNEYSEIVEAGLNKLSPRKRLIFSLKTYKGFSNGEIAKQLDISINTVKVQFSQANKFLKDYLKQRAEIEV